MDTNIVITIIGAIGGAEGLRWIITAWMNRKTNARKEDAAAKLKIKRKEKCKQRDRS